MTFFPKIDFDIDRCCDNPPLFMVKIHRRDDTLLGGKALDVCHEHLGLGTQKALQALLDEEDVYAVTLMLP